MLLRSDIKKAIREAEKWFYAEQKKEKNSSIYKAAENYLRGSNFIIWYDEAIYKLNNIEYYYDEINDGFWAETDGIKIWLNTFQDWNDELLKNTLIHTALHFTIRSNGKYDISERKEHNIMMQINPDLINH
jgi:hypothetical protein